MNKITPLALAALCVSSTPAWAISVGYPDHGVVSVAATATMDPTTGTLTLNNVDTAVTRNGLASVNDNLGGVATTSTDYGLNHAYASYANTDTNSVASAAASLWYDQITITGGSGTGTATLKASLNGTTDVGAPDGAAFYVLGTSAVNPMTLTSSTISFNSVSLPLSVDTSQLTTVASYAVGTQGAATACTSQLGNTCPTFNQILGTGTGQAIQANLAGNLSFTYGQSFYLVGLLTTGAGQNFSTATPATTTFDFSNTGLLNQIVLPQGAILSDASGTIYNVAAVPEPAEWLTLVAGLGLVGLVARRRA